MGVRWYDAQIGRWLSADTIVPDYADPQSLDRFAYVLGNPLRYVDPTGHMTEYNCADGYCRGRASGSSAMDVDQDPEPPPPPQLGVGPWYRGAESHALALNVMGALADTFAFGASVIGAVLQDSIWLLAAAATAGFPVGDVGGFAAGVAQYQVPFNNIENAAGWTSLGCTLWADRLAGYTYLDLADTPSGYPELVLGQDTSMDLLLSGIGGVWPEGNVDALLNGIQMVNSFKSILQEPTWEVRVVFLYGDYEGQYSYIRGYDDNGWYVITDLSQGKIYDDDRDLSE
jgi:hypothetical protein